MTRAELRSHLVIGDAFTEDDTLIDAYNQAATAWAEEFCCRRLCEQTLELTLEEFPCGPICLPWGEVRSITSVQYYDVDGALQTWSSAEYVSDLPTGRIEPAEGYSYPATQARIGAVKVRWVAGYQTSGSPTDLSAIPAAIKQAIKLLVGQFYEQRENIVVGVQPAQIPLGVEALLWPYRIMSY